MYTLENPDLKINKEKIEELKTDLGNVEIVAATKYITEPQMEELYKAGIRSFGENRVEPFIRKRFVLRNLDIKWHFIGHLQRNKAKLMINDIDYLHSLDSLELCKQIEKLRDKPLDCFIEVKLVDNYAKNGVLEAELDDFINNAKQYSKVNIIGLMTMTEPNMTDQEKSIIFNKLHELGEKYDLMYYSMGMSDDYLLAKEAGSTHVRLGRILYK